MLLVVVVGTMLVVVVVRTSPRPEAMRAGWR
jgi:hypothetical protein